MMMSPDHSASEAGLFEEPFQSPTATVAVLLGGGVESTFLVQHYLQSGYQVIPVRVHCGLLWDDVESAFARQFCLQLSGPRLHPLVETRVSLRETLGSHWAVTGVGVPAAGARSAALEIPLRNLTLLGFAYHSLRHRGDFSLAMGTTAENDYRDGTRMYFDRCEEVLSLEAGRRLNVLTPVIGWSKSQVIQHSHRSTLAASFSCVSPQGGRHCGNCIKCGKRRESFRVANVDDPTDYASD